MNILRRGRNLSQTLYHITTTGSTELISRNKHLSPIYVHMWEENQRHVRMSIAPQESCFHHYKSIHGDYDFYISVLHSSVG